MRSKIFETILILSTVALAAAVLAIEFWPGSGPAPEAVVAEYLARVQVGDEVGALALWHRPLAVEAPVPPVALGTLATGEPDDRGDRENGGTDMVDFTIALADTLNRYQVEPATYWTSCCELQQLDDGADAFSARVAVEARLHEAGCGLEPSTIPEADLSAASYTFHLVDTAHNVDAYNWGAPWERWYARPRGRQVWRIVAVDGNG